jgi:hypothetical protein
MNEIWLDIPGYEGRYQVSNLGMVKSLLTRRCILQPAISQFGYLKVNLYGVDRRKTFLIHRLVGLTFIPNLSDKPEINHINGNKFDNRAENLEWVSSSENKRHAVRLGLKVGKTGKESHFYGKPSQNRKKIKGVNLQTLQEVVFESRLAAEIFTDCSGGNITNVCLGKLKSTKGWFFSYVDKTA